jgi:hypothetical protein
MSYRTPSTPAIERPHRVPDSTRAIVCLCCGDTMKHVPTLPNFECVRKSSSSSALPAKGSRQRRLYTCGTEPLRTDRSTQLSKISDASVSLTSGTFRHPWPSFFFKMPSFGCSFVGRADEMIECRSSIGTLWGQTEKCRDGQAAIG